MIKKIQLRGISRTPSDRMNADGGCSESLNVHIDQTETAPTLPPEDISSDIYGGNKRLPIVFVHKMLGLTNYIGYDKGANKLLAYGSTLEGIVDYEECDGVDPMGDVSLGVYETLKHVSSIGNTLVVFSDVKPYYFLFKESHPGQKCKLGVRSIVSLVTYFLAAAVGGFCPIAAFIVVAVVSAWWIVPEKKKA